MAAILAPFHFEITPGSRGLGGPVKGRVSQFVSSFICPVYIIYGGKIVETACSDLKLVQNCKIR